VGWGVGRDRFQRNALAGDQKLHFLKKDRVFRKRFGYTSIDRSLHPYKHIVPPQTSCCFFLGRPEIETVSSERVSPPTVLQRGARRRERSGGLDPLPGALFAVYVRGCGIAVAEREGSGEYG